MVEKKKVSGFHYRRLLIFLERERVPRGLCVILFFLFFSKNGESGGEAKRGARRRLALLIGSARRAPLSSDRAPLF